MTICLLLINQLNNVPSVQDQIDSGNDLYDGVDIRFVGLFDTVPSKRNGLFGYSNEYEESSEEMISQDLTDYDLAENTKTFRFSLPGKMKFSNKPVHLVSIDESRKEFATVDLDRALQVGFRGVHSDVGGGDKNNAFDWIARNFMVEKATEAGVTFNLKKINQFGGWGSRGKGVGYQWPTAYSNAQRSNMPPSYNDELYFNYNEPRVLPKNMLLHPSVRYFSDKPKNNIYGYRYLDE